MFNIDQFAYNNRLRHVHPLEKLLLTGLTMGAVLSHPQPVVTGLVLLIMNGILWGRAGIPLRYLVRLLLLPFSFLLLSAWTILLSLSTEPVSGIITWKIGPLFAGIDWRQLGLALRVILQALAAVSCLYFLILTTPMVEILGILRRLQIPPLLLELMGLVYRFIFVLAETAVQIQISQASRWGYASLGNSYRSLGQLITALLFKSQQRSRQLYQALEARGYQGELRVLEPEYHWSGANLALIALVQMVLWFMALNGGGEKIVIFHS
ncbi:MAG: cobalt ECF transporter T component CbiQ [Bacillota bacterium]|uniref:Cobalt/nickel transport system permease protein n=2 Tax=Carboxydocella TaxID=178898 RepID=A0A1T4QPB1_9FIRM|nr:MULTISPECIES: cobalt ECF transporter T component CbiQ [Carboxydocella]AVX21546.1 cobalt/nickel transport system permease protein [Carboxydocella thermautotrophica]AVX32027.1 cobalt/nickel transport system permease protein [Carboxydocella thermautotrophica]SKA05600.1 cobalt/nickel transport system permease protein [Carboxydocella sporoproducens DSM 16521]